MLVMLGDFNAKMGVLKAGESDWEDVLGKYGLDERNERRETSYSSVTISHSNFLSTPSALSPATCRFLLILTSPKLLLHTAKLN